MSQKKKAAKNVATGSDDLTVFMETFCQRYLGYTASQCRELVPKFVQVLKRNHLKSTDDVLLAFATQPDSNYGLPPALVPQLRNYAKGI